MSGKGPKAASKHHFGTLNMVAVRKGQISVRPLSWSEQRVDAYTPTSSQLREQDELKVKRAWQVATSPFQSSVMMTGIMLWMAGSGINIWSIMMTFFALSSPITAIAGVDRAFSGFRSSETKQPLSLPLQKLVYVLLHLVALGIGLYKLRSLGLLPTQWSDIYGHMQTRAALQHVATAVRP
eukprot:a842615_807.p1 GENE.a842615_807~~a842615_807.p1  ORF type:complete len:192 (+),score=50.21 a842615_807:35-577(+)